MSESGWIIKTHTIAAAFPRENLRSVRTPASRLKTVINQYIPKSNQNPSPGDVTIILAHANGYHKELYEPLFDEILARAQSSGFRIKAIWSPEAAHQGASGVVNENELGDDPCWNNFSRDIENMINNFQNEITHPIVGMGHSMGGQAIFECALRNPDLFVAVVGLDPVIQPESKENNFTPQVTAMTIKRRDIWPSREEAEKFFKSRPFYTAWHPKVLERQLKYGIRPTPTRLYPAGSCPPGSFTLTTTKHQEAFTFLRIPDQPNGIIGRPEPGFTFERLHELKIPILWIFGGASEISTPESMKAKMAKNPNNAEMVILPKGSHSLPQQLPEETADAVAPFLAKHVRRWEKETEKNAKEGPVGFMVSDKFAKLSKI